MPGYTTNGLPLVSAPTLNGVAQVAPNGVVGEMSSTDLIAVDTGMSAGEAPQSVAATVFQVVALAAAMVHNTQTSTAHAATSNTFSGQVITEALTTAAGSTYTFTLTNSLVTAAGAAVQVDIRSGTNTTPGMAVTSVTNAAGSVVFVFTNSGTAAINGTMVIAWHV